MEKTTTTAALAAALLLVGGARAQELPDTFKNLQVLDKSITKAELKKVMDGFTDQLGVKCTHCHVLDEYDKDTRPHKQDARRMILLVQHMRASKAKYFKPEVTEEQITCWTCHRGEAEPAEYVP